MRASTSACFATAVVAVGAGIGGSTFAADHGDTPVLIGAGRNDANITDLFAFTRGDNLVLAVCLDNAVPGSVTEYQFSPDLEVEILIDTNCEVSFDDADANAEFGGTIVRPKKIKEDIRLRIDVDRNGTPRLFAHLDQRGPKRMRFLRSGEVRSGLRFFSGLVDDPFIRGPRAGRNVAALVIEMPLESVIDEQDTIVVWATSHVPGFDGPFQDLAGRALRSQFPENDAMNTVRPRDQEQDLGVRPDVIIFNTALPASFPNGRDLPDDVVDLVGDPRVLASDAPFPSTNDAPFRSEFPYLALPHLP